MGTLVGFCHPFVNIKGRLRVVYFVAILLAPLTRDWVRSTVHLQAVFGDCCLHKLLALPYVHSCDKVISLKTVVQGQQQASDHLVD